jgi:ubiquinone/menaquinone biosynthesis C-methylase UbiE
MSVESEIKQQVREFYDQVGWQQVSEGVYQNAHYEDLRPVSREYIHRCHLRVGRHLAPRGRFLLDAGSGPIQYPEYLTYSAGYDFRVCADISSVALLEARQRLGKGGLYVVCDVANLPFKPEAFEGVVSLHTIHHLPEEQHLQAYRELQRVLQPGCNAAVVNGWPESKLMQAMEPLVRLGNRLRHRLGQADDSPAKRQNQSAMDANQPPAKSPKGTFTSRHDAAWVRSVVGAEMPVQIFVWRSVSVRFLRSLVHLRLGGRWFLKLLYWLEERMPRFFGENGQYPLIVICK